MKFTLSLFLLPFAAFLFSCTTTKPNVVYFPTLRDSAFNRQLEEVEPPIATNDLLNISVSGLDPEAVALLNKGSHGSSSASSSPGSGASGGDNGYLVSKEGFIQFPLIGQVKAAGLTKKELAATLTQQISSRKLLLDPIISIRQANYHITVLGEVAHPGVFQVPSEQINILEALGMAGDATLTAKKENVLLIRQEGGKKLSKRLNLSSNDILTSPYFNLRSNDIVYVEPSESKVKTVEGKQSIVPIVLSSISVVLLLVSQITK